MTKYTSILVDDELHSRELLKGFLSKYCKDLELLDEATNVEGAYQKIVERKPQIVFLDISLLEKNAFNLLEKFNDITFEIIFITAYDNYAIRAIKFSAIDYLLKPINIEHLVNSVQKACKRIDEKTTINHFKYFSENIRKKEGLPKIALPTLEGFIFIETDQIIRCHASGSYTEFFLLDQDKPILVSKGLKEYEGLLEGNNFLRVHNSHLINLDHATAYHKGKLSYVTMSDKSTVEVSVRKREEFLAKLKDLKA